MTVRLGDVYLGARTNDPAAADAMRAVLAPHLAEDVIAPPNVSLLAGEPETTAARPFHFLYTGARTTVRSTSIARLLRSLPAQLAWFLEPPAGVSRLAARAVVRDGAVVLVDIGLVGSLLEAERRLRRDGFELADAPYVSVDAATFGLVVEPPPLTLVDDALAAVDREWPTDGESVDLGASPYEVAGMIVGAQPDEESPARALSQLAPLVVDAESRARATDIELIARIGSAWPIVRTGYVQGDELYDVIRELA